MYDFKGFGEIKTDNVSAFISPNPYKIQKNKIKLISIISVILSQTKSASPKATITRSARRSPRPTK